MEPDIALGHGRAFGKRHVKLLLCFLPVVVQRLMDHPHLRPVPVPYKDLISLFDEIRYRRRGEDHSLRLLLRRIAEGVPAQCHYCPLLHPHIVA